MKKMKFVSGICVAGMLVLGGMTGCGADETKSNAKQQESQKERDMKEADKAAMEYVKAMIDVDIARINDLQYEKFDFGEGVIPSPGASKSIGERYDLYRYNLKEGKEEYYYHVVYYHPVEKAQKSENLKMVKDERDGKWKNYKWAWDANNSLDAIVGSMKPAHVHKWGQKE
ncbi:hypothetical protein [Bacillus wiedmannii]|uniref:hypothetical protein n=1 Tax=Bacillus wiedmannii TaxID=1890302 RepID=UPI000BEDC467|nr:hypothetical protein [Bacillus wiedmannii]PEF35110.1 hypothetical protein CON72_18680 [Bacillus wiedmannii]